MSWKANLGSFSKATAGAVSANFSESGDSNCSKTCTMHPANGGACYAVHVEKMKPSVRVSGERRRSQGFARTCLDMQADLSKRLDKGASIPWFRFSSFGSVPNRPLSGLEEKAFIHLAETIPAETPVHFPVETEAKRARFQALLDSAGLGHITVRVSTQTAGKARSALGKSVAGSVVWTEGANKRERLAKAQAFAARTRGAMVCPAIRDTVENNKPKEEHTKCGNCTACAKPGLMIVYPQH